VKIERRPAAWHATTVALLLVGYAGYYACRANLSVTRTSIVEEYASAGMTLETIGIITSIGTLLYAVGKFIGGTMSDLFGGRRMFLTGMGGAVFFTVLFAAVGPAVFLLAWSGNRLVQSWGWGGMVKIVGRWFPSSAHGRVMGVVSLSFLFGDFVSKLALGQLLKLGWDWRQVFYAAAAALALIFVATLMLLREAPADRGLPEPEVADEAPAPGALGPGALLGPLMRNPTFWIVCALSFGFTMMRETFNEWTPTYFEQAVGLSKGDAGQAASLFPLMGGISVLLVGWLSDRVRTTSRALIIAGGLALGAAGLVALTLSPNSVQVAMVAAIGFVLIGPYSLLAGAISLEIGGKERSASACGWIDGVGYVGGILSGYGIARVATVAGWDTAWRVLAVVALVSAIAALAYWWSERRPRAYVA
jgi:OPA family glycerol-3-phosphate transporter-like MFS transporter